MNRSQFLTALFVAPVAAALGVKHKKAPISVVDGLHFQSVSIGCNYVPTNQEYTEYLFQDIDFLHVKPVNIQTIAEFYKVPTCRLVDLPRKTFTLKGSDLYAQIIKSHTPTP